MKIPGNAKIVALVDEEGFALILVGDFIATFNSFGAAVAGAEVENRRRKPAPPASEE